MIKNFKKIRAKYLRYKKQNVYLQPQLCERSGSSVG